MKWYIDFLVIGGAILPVIFMILFLRKKKKLLQNGLIANGEIIELFEDEGDFYPVISFTAVTGEKIIKKYKESFPKSELIVGNKIKVYYNHQIPASFIIDTKLSKWLPYVIISSSFVFIIVYLVIRK